MDLLLDGTDNFETRFLLNDAAVKFGIPWVYGGAVGYLSFTGNMDLAIAIRTMVAHAGRVHLQAGAGIVADSDPEAEYQETINKAMGVRKAIDLARGGLD